MEWSFGLSLNEIIAYYRIRLTIRVKNDLKLSDSRQGNSLKTHYLNINR